MLELLLIWFKYFPRNKLITFEYFPFYRELSEPTYFNPNNDIIYALSGTVFTNIFTYGDYAIFEPLPWINFSKYYV